MLFLNEIINLARNTINDYEFARKSKANLDHANTYYYCKKALSKIAIISYTLSNDTIVDEELALNWVEELPTPNGLYSMLIKAYKELSDRETPILNFLLSIPVSTHNLYLIKDAISELFHNIKKRDEKQDLYDYLRNWEKNL